MKLYHTFTLKLCALHPPEVQASSATTGSGQGRLPTAPLSPPRLLFLPLLVAVAEGEEGIDTAVGHKARLRSPDPAEAAWPPSGAKAIARVGFYSGGG
jgi:hypothetical protein